MPYASETLLPSGTVSNRLYAGVIRLTLTGVMACGEVPSDSGDLLGVRPDFSGCNVDTDFMVVGAAFDGIASLDEPVWVQAPDRVPSYLEPQSRVIGLLVNGQP